MNLVTAHIPAKTLPDLRLALGKAAEHLLSRGKSSMQLTAPSNAP